MPASGVVVEEQPLGPPPIEGASTVVAFVGDAGSGDAIEIESLGDFEAAYGAAADAGDLGQAVALFFENGGYSLWIAPTLQALDAVAQVDLMALPGVSDPASQVAALAYAEQRGAFLILDPPASASALHGAVAWLSGAAALRHPNAAAYVPRVIRDGATEPVANSGAVAGVMIRIERERGVWTAPAGERADLAGVEGLETAFTDADSQALNTHGLNTLRSFPDQRLLVWGARTLAGDDAQPGDWKYVPIRRLALFIERSLGEGLKWTVFEPNAEPLWANVRLRVGAFFQGLFRDGAFAGQTPRDAYAVRCDAATMTQDDIAAGRLVVEVGFAPLRPAEFVVLTLTLVVRPPDGTP
jgi:phage tail sheath protein FI